MKLTESALRQIVKQELATIINELEEKIFEEKDAKTRLVPSQADIEAVESSEEPDPKNPIAKWYKKKSKKGQHSKWGE